MAWNPKIKALLAILFISSSQTDFFVDVYTILIRAVHHVISGGSTMKRLIQETMPVVPLVLDVTFHSGGQVQITMHWTGREVITPWYCCSNRVPMELFVRYIFLAFHPVYSCAILRQWRRLRFGCSPRRWMGNASRGSMLGGL